MAKKTANIQYYEAIGRRRESVARVRLHIVSTKNKSVTFKGNKVEAGNIVINDKQIQDYFQTATMQKMIVVPLHVTDNVDRFAITIQVEGGGKKGQLDACIHGIARALVMVDEEYKPTLKQHELLTRDARTRERRTAGKGGKSRRKKQSPKR